ncbi:hypothetical protein QWJ90_04240 [Microbacterium oryzae]|uniref:hypothetical protein n=1 Tax=Microbacterium oryzae TaxID=743009 RepID=UPI0025B1059E|nr:hypothetical protein [Microbacterium oryzae]MDN3310135.1 hypothetical protein [Microbacterium oryzae]
MTSDTRPLNAEPLHTDALDTAPLTARVRGRDVRRFWRRFRDVPGARQPGRGARVAVVTFGALVIPIGLLAMSVGVAQEIEEAAPDMAEQLTGMSVMVLLFLVAGAVLTWASVRMGARRRSRREFFRLARFAAVNGLDFAPGLHDGSHLEPWRERGRVGVIDAMRTRGGRPVEFGNYEIRTSEGHRAQATFGGYAATRVGTALPNIRLESRRVRRVMSEGAVAREQRLSLEGDFDRAFTLTCPQGYETDALYLFTPDVAALLMDAASDFDIELIDDWVFLTSPADVVTLRAERWQNVESALRAVVAKIDQWERWRDDRVARTRLSGPGIVAQAGRRLRIGVGAGTVITGFGIAAFTAMALIVGALG